MDRQCAHRRADLSVVYPVSRGTGIALVPVADFVAVIACAAVLQVVVGSTLGLAPVC